MDDQPCCSYSSQLVDDIASSSSCSSQESEVVTIDDQPYCSYSSKVVKDAEIDRASTSSWSSQSTAEKKHQCNVSHPLSSRSFLYFIVHLGGSLCISVHLRIATIQQTTNKTLMHTCGVKSTSKILFEKGLSLLGHLLLR